MTPKVSFVKAKTVLTKTKLPGCDWVVNPYNGCLFGCMYCYAAQIGRWKHPDEEWRSYLDIKINAPKLLRKALEKLEKKFKSKDFGTIFFSSVTDPYVGPEAKYKLTRKCLQLLADFGYQGEIAIQTKSPLVVKDIDILKKLKKVTVGFTVTTLNDKISRFLEVKAPSVTLRLRALKRLDDSGISTYAFVGPILPYFTDKEDKINQLLDKLEEVGICQVCFEHINLSPKIKARLYDFLRKRAADLIPEFEKADNEEYRQELDRVIKKALKGRNIKMGFSKVIHHRKLAKKKW